MHFDVLAGFRFLSFDEALGIAENDALADTITADPQFVNYTGDSRGDYRLKPSSPALRSGSTEGAPAEDIEDRSRSGSGIDIGAYQSAVGPRSVLATR